MPAQRFAPRARARSTRIWRIERAARPDEMPVIGPCAPLPASRRYASWTQRGRLQRLARLFSTHACRAASRRSSLVDRHGPPRHGRGPVGCGQSLTGRAPIAEPMANHRANGGRPCVGAKEILVRSLMLSAALCLVPCVVTAQTNPAAQAGRKWRQAQRARDHR